jgi:predicted nucleic acid-binding protein
MVKGKKDFSERLKQRFPDFEKEWRKLVSDFGTEMVNTIKQKLSGEYSFLKELAEFKFKIIVDNNFIFSQIKGAIKKKYALEASFIYKLLKSSSIEMYGPHLLKEELLEKVKTVLPEHERELGTSYALTLLSKIRIQDAMWTDDWKKANRLIGEHDPDDVSYLALAFEIGGHGILSLDNVFHRQGDINVWKHHEMGKVVTNFNSGFVSMTLMDQTGQLIVKILTMVFKFIKDALVSIVKLLVNLAAGIVKGLASLPPLVMIGLITLGIIYADDIKKHGKEFFSYVVERANEILIRVKIALREIIDLLKKALDVVHLGATVTFEFLGYLLNEYHSMYEQVKELNIDFPKQLIPNATQGPVMPLPDLRFGSKGIQLNKSA